MMAQSKEGGHVEGSRCQEHEARGSKAAVLKRGAGVLPMGRPGAILWCCAICGVQSGPPAVHGLEHRSPCHSTQQAAAFLGLVLGWRSRVRVLKVCRGVPYPLQPGGRPARLHVLPRASIAWRVDFASVVHRYNHGARGASCSAHRTAASPPVCL